MSPKTATPTSLHSVAPAANKSAEQNFGTPGPLSSSSTTMAAPNLSGGGTLLRVHHRGHGGARSSRGRERRGFTCRPPPVRLCPLSSPPLLSPLLLLLFLVVLFLLLFAVPNFYPIVCSREDTCDVIVLLDVLPGVVAAIGAASPSSGSSSWSSGGSGIAAVGVVSPASAWARMLSRGGLSAAASEHKDGVVVTSPAASLFSSL